MSFYKNKRVAVLGGAGMIGSQLVELLIEQEAEVTVIDNFSRGRRENLAGLMCQIEAIDTLRQTATLDQTLEWHQFEVVFNLAAKVTGMHYNKDHHAEMYYVNTMLLTVPLIIALRNKVPYFLQASTVCVYPHNMTYPVGEDEGHVGEPEPTNAGYGWAKRMGERYAQWVAQEHGMKIGVTRFSNVLGPRDYFDDETSHVIPALIKRTLSDEPHVTVYGSGEQVREFLYSRDAAMGAMKVMEHVHDATPINVGNPNNRISINALARLIMEMCGVNKTLYNITGEFPEGYPKRGSDITLLKAKTGWRPETTLEDGLIEAIKWYKENKEIA